MRYDAEHKQKTRERVLKEAAAAIRVEGPHRIAVAGVMAKAGLTHGGFYAHFASKEELIAAAIGQMFDEAADRFDRETGALDPARGLAAYINFYLSRTHRDTSGQGCPLPYLAADLPRLTPDARTRFAAGRAALAARTADLLARLGRPEPEMLADSVVAELVGALSLARAEPDLDRSDQILKSSRRMLKQRLGLETPQ
jgi:TetR/AcrR family transcriptional repressor of nem operon